MGRSRDCSIPHRRYFLGSWADPVPLIFLFALDTSRSAQNLMPQGKLPGVAWQGGIFTHATDRNHASKHNQESNIL